MVDENKNVGDEDLDVEPESEEDEGPITYDIVSYPSDLTLNGINELFKNGDLIISADFQRNFVWNMKQASLLIDSFLLGLPVPQVFFYIDESNKNIVIDGQQRIMSIVYFLDGHFGSESIQGKQTVFRLQGLDEKSQFADKRFDELSEEYQRKLKSAVLRAINIRQLNPKNETTSIYHIFERLNTGGTPLKPQEIRNCIYRGNFSQRLRDLNKDKNWRLIMGKDTLDKHQKDIELLLRIFAFTYYFKDYEKPMKDFLSSAMSSNKTGDTDDVNNFVDRFPRVAKLIIESWGNKPFHIRGPLNSSALDSVFATMMHSEHIATEDLSSRYSKLKDDNNFVLGTSYGTSDVTSVNKRFQAAQHHLLDK